MKTVFLLALLLIVFKMNAFAQLEELTPRYMLWNISGFQSATQENADGTKVSGWGVWSIGIPELTPAFSIKDKVYLGGYFGLEIGIGYPLSLLAKIPMGFSLGYRISDDLFISGKYFCQIQTTTLIKTSNDDGWVVGASIRYKNLMVDFHQNVGDKNQDGFFSYRMGYDNFHVFPKYIFRFKKRDTLYWVGVRYETFKAQYAGAEFYKSSTVDVLFGKIVSW